MENNIYEQEDFLLRKSIFRIGEVASVDGREVSIRVDREKNLSHIIYKGELLSNVSVGAYVKIIKGFNRLIGKIEKEYVKENLSLTEYSQTTERFTRYLFIKVLGYFHQGKYHKGVKELPLIGDECLLLDAEEYQQIHRFGDEKDNSIRLGSLMTDERVSIDVSVNKLFASHIGIFGNTGSGKSHTLVTLYKNLFHKFGDQKNFQKNARFLLFDFNGEYSNATSITRNKKVYKLSTSKDNADKLQLAPSDILTPELFFILASATEKTQQPFIRRALRLYGNASGADNTLDYTKAILKDKLKRILSLGNRLQADMLLGYLESILSHRNNLRGDLSWHGTKSCFMFSANGRKLYCEDADALGQISGLSMYKAIDSMKKSDFISWLTKFLYIQLIDDLLSNRAQSEHVAPAINKLKSMSKDFTKVFEVHDSSDLTSLWEEEKPLVVIDLNQVNTAMKKLIPLLISHKYYQQHKSLKNKVVTSYLNIIIDEAHNILSYESTRESESWKDFRLETFEEIIKEGRKFGVFLTIASQRPSDISSTIISQLHNYLIHRLINQRDLEMVERAIAYLDKLSIDSLPILPAGACVLSGVIADLPLILQVDKLGKDDQPESQTITLTDCCFDSTH